LWANECGESYSSPPILNMNEEIEKVIKHSAIQLRLIANHAPELEDSIRERLNDLANQVEEIVVKEHGINRNH
jgi:hypothetical protein